MGIKCIALFVGICIAVISCNNEDKSTQHKIEPAKDSASAFKIRSALEWEPLLQEADSLEILYFDDPDGDSLRYTRFFSYVATKDTGVISALLANFRQPVHLLNAIKDCRSEGKIYVFGRQQQPLKTVYFSTRGDSCSYLYFIKSGMFYYSPLSGDLKNKLRDNKKLSRKP